MQGKGKLKEKIVKHKEGVANKAKIDLVEDLDIYFE